MSTDLKSIARDALDVQNACNPRGVLLAWHKALCLVWDDIDARNAINVLYLSKMTSLLRADADSIGSVSLGLVTTGTTKREWDFTRAYDWAKRVAQ